MTLVHAMHELNFGVYVVNSNHTRKYFNHIFFPLPDMSWSCQVTEIFSSFSNRLAPYPGLQVVAIHPGQRRDQAHRF